jgi:hypothetical protein
VDGGLGVGVEVVVEVALEGEGEEESVVKEQRKIEKSVEKKQAER